MNFADFIRLKEVSNYDTIVLYKPTILMYQR